VRAARLRRHALAAWVGVALVASVAGGGVTYRLSFTRAAAPALFDQADQFLGFTPRSVSVDGVRQDEGLTLCGAQAPPCPG
jgi:hypothetical protein